jgi:hypothetical protein
MENRAEDGRIRPRTFQMVPPSSRLTRGAECGAESGIRRCVTGSWGARDRVPNPGCGFCAPIGGPMMMHPSILASILARHPTTSAGLMMARPGPVRRGLGRPRLDFCHVGTKRWRIARIIAGPPGLGRCVPRQQRDRVPYPRSGHHASTKPEFRIEAWGKPFGRAFRTPCTADNLELSRA